MKVFWKMNTINRNLNMEDKTYRDFAKQDGIIHCKRSFFSKVGKDNIKVRNMWIFFQVLNYKQNLDWISHYQKKKWIMQSHFWWFFVRILALTSFCSIRIDEFWVTDLTISHFFIRKRCMQSLLVPFMMIY